MTLVWDKSLISSFIEEVVPELKDDEVYICILVCRKKYSNKVSRSEEMMDKLIVKHKEDLLRKLVRFLRVEEGDFIDFNTGEPIPLEAMAAYIDLYPKSCIKAIKHFNSITYQWLYQRIKDPNFELSNFKKLHTKWFSSLAKSNSRAPVKIVDVDKKDVVFVHRDTVIYGKESGEPVILPAIPDWITQTRGGYHLIYKEPDKATIVELSKLPQLYDFVEIAWHQGQTVIPGTLQGGYFTKRVKVGNRVRG